MEITETEGFIHAIKLPIAIQPKFFPDERTKILYALSFMTGGSAHTWAQNETETIITNTSTTDSLEEFLNCLEKAFGCCFSLPRGNKVDCMTDIGWGEFARITTRGLGEVREMLRMNF